MVHIYFELICGILKRFRICILISFGFMKGLYNSDCPWKLNLLKNKMREKREIQMKI